MLKAKESKGVEGGKRSKKSTHVRFFLPSSPPPPNLDDDDDDDHADHADPAPSRSSSHYSSSLSSSTSSLRSPARAYPSPYSSSSSSSSSSQPPRRPPPIAPSSSSSSRPPHRPPPAAPSPSPSSSSSRVRLPPSSFSYLAPPATLGSSAPTSTASPPRRGPPSTAFFAPPPSRPLLSTSSSSAASLPGSSSSASGMIGAGGWTRYRSAVDRASAAAAAPSSSSASTADRRPSPPPPRWRDDTDVSSSSDDDRTLTDATTTLSSSSAASPPPPSMSATEGEATTDGEITHPSLSSAMSSGVSSSSSSSSSFGHSPVPSLSSPVSSPRAPAAASSTSPRRAPSPLASSSSSYQPPRLPRPASPAPIEPAPTSFACARPFGGVKDVDDVAAALEAWLIPPASSRGATTNKKKTKIRFGVEVGRLSQPRCSLRVSHLTGTEGRRARKWADVRSNTVAVSFAFAVKEGVNVFELGELSGSIKNLLLLVDSDELDTDLESKLVDEGPGTSKILLLNLLFRDECLFHAISAVLAHHRIEQADASLLLSQSPADCRSRRARLEGIDARLVVDAVIGRSILGFVEELVANLRREAVPPASADQENENEEKERRRSERENEERRGGGTRRHRATKEEKRRVAGAMLRKYGQQLLGIPPAAVAGLGDVDAITRLVHLLRALNDIRFFVEFDSLDSLVRRLWPTPGTADNGDDEGPRRSLSEEGELLGAAKKAKKKTKTKTKNETTEDAKRKKKTKEKKKKRLSGSASKRQSADTARHRRNSSSSSSRRRDAVDVGAGDDGGEAQQWESYSWHSLHAYLLASYDQLVRQTTAAAASVDGDGDGDGDDHDVDSGARPRDMGREIEEGIVASVRDMMLKLQSLSTIHSVRAIAGNDVLLVACEGMDLFAVLPSPDEMIAIERAAKSEARRRKKKNESEAIKKTKKEEERRKKKKTTKETESGADCGAGVRSSAAAAVLSTPGIPGMPSRPLAPKRDKVNIKLMVLGDLRVGKTSLIQRFLRGSAFTMPKYKPTYAADFVHKNVVLRDKPRTLQIWDTSGNERQRAPDRAFFKGVDALVLVFDQRRASTFAPALDRHLDDFLAHAACPDPRLLPVVVIGNRGGEKNESESEAAAGTTGKQSESESEGGEREVRRSEVEAWCRGRIEGNRLFAYFEASAREGAHVDDAFLHAANAVLDVHHGAVH